MNGTALSRVDELLATPISTRSLAALRISVGLLTVVHLRSRSIEAFAGDTHHDRFHEPYVDLLASIPLGPYQAIMVVGSVSAICLTVGLATRATAWLSFGAVAFHLLISTTHVHNNRAYLVTILLLVALAPSGHSWSVDRWWTRRRPERGLAVETATETTTGWHLWLLRGACATVYAASGFSKLIDPDWFGGTVTWGRVTLGEEDLRSSVLPAGVVDVVLDRSFHTFAAKAIVLTELFIALGLWWRRTRMWAVLTAILFHVMIEVSSNVQLFSWLAVAVLVVWFDPDLGGLGTRRWAREDHRFRAFPGVSPTTTASARVSP